MNYSNMIEEKHLKKGFIIATLCSTIIGTFTTSIGLYDRLADRRKQKKRDIGQDEEIQKLKKQVEQAPSSRGRPRDEVGDSLERSGALIRREYDEGYERLGRRFAIGDAMTENRLQAQIIALQQTVIKVLQDAVYDGRDLTRADMSKLMSASRVAREGSLDALRQQRERQMLAIEPPPPAEIAAPPSAPGPRKRAATVVEQDDPLFCRYSLDLQYVKGKPLAYSFAPGQDCRCPDCGLRVDVESEEFWNIAKRAPVIVMDKKKGLEKEILEEVEFQIGQRFVVKCHTPNHGEYACVLCARYRDKDAILPSVEALINHVGRSHDTFEMDKEVDIIKLPPPGTTKAATPSPVSSKSSARRSSKRSSSPSSVGTSLSSMPEAPSPPLAQMMNDLDLRDRRVEMPSKYR